MLCWSGLAWGIVVGLWAGLLIGIHLVGIHLGRRY